MSMPRRSSILMVDLEAAKEIEENSSTKSPFAIRPRVVLFRYLLVIVLIFTLSFLGIMALCTTIDNTAYFEYSVVEVKLHSPTIKVPNSFKNISETHDGREHNDNPLEKTSQQRVDVEHTENSSESNTEKQTDIEKIVPEPSKKIDRQIATPGFINSHLSPGVQTSTYTWFTSADFPDGSYIETGPGGSININHVKSKEVTVLAKQSDFRNEIGMIINFRTFLVSNDLNYILLTTDHESVIF